MIYGDNENPFYKMMESIKKMYPYFMSTGTRDNTV